MNKSSTLCVGIDNISPGASTSLKTIGGMRHFLEGIVEQLPAYGPQHAFELFTPVWSEEFETSVRENLHVIRCAAVPRYKIGRVLYEQLILPWQLRRRRVAVWLASCNTLPLAWTGPSVLIVQSLQYLSHPEGLSWARRKYLQLVGVASVKRATRLVTFSEAAKLEIVARTGVPPAKIAVIPHAFRFSRAMPANAGDEQRAEAAVRAMVSGGPYVLCVSAFYAYKNLFRLLEAFARLKPEFPHRLVLAGSETAAVSRAELAAAADRLGITRDVVFAGRVSDQELCALYRNAAVMAMPSLEETFGLPVLEAMALGCPVVTSNTSSMPEITGEAAVLVDPLDVERIAEGIRHVLRSPDARRHMIEAGKVRAQEFTYDRFFRQLAEVIEMASRQAVMSGRLDG